MKKLIKALPILFLLFTAVSVQAVENPKVIRLGSPGNGVGLPVKEIMNVIVQKGLWDEEFQKDGIKLDLSLIKTAGPGCNEGFAAGLFDFGKWGDFPFVVAKAAGVKSKLILSCDIGNNIYIQVPTNSKITSLNDLKGKRVGLGVGTITQYTFANLLLTHGLSEKDIHLINISGSDGQAALITNGLDALVSTQDRPLVTQGLAKVIYDTRLDPIEIKGSNGLIVSEAFANKYPELTKRVVKVFIRAAYWASQPKNRAELIKIQLKSGDKYQFIKDDYLAQDVKERLNPRLTPTTVNQYRHLVDFSLKYKYIRKAFDVDKWVDRSYSEAALKELGLEKFWPNK